VRGNSYLNAPTGAVKTPINVHSGFQDKKSQSFDGSILRAKPEVADKDKIVRTQSDSVVAAPVVLRSASSDGLRFKHAYKRHGSFDILEPTQEVDDWSIHAEGRSLSSGYLPQTDKSMSVVMPPGRSLVGGYLKEVGLLCVYIYNYSLVIILIITIIKTIFILIILIITTTRIKNRRCCGKRRRIARKKRKNFKGEEKMQQ